MVSSGGSGVILEFFEWLEGLGAKYRGSCKIWGFFRDFWEFLERLEWFRTVVQFTRITGAYLQNRIE
jgi:hypothetical protein